MPILKEKEYDFFLPKRADLNLKDENEVVDYLKQHNFDVVLHLANPTPSKNPLDTMETLMEDSMRLFMNLYNHQDLFGKMIYTGSGAEYDKTQNIDLIEETECFRNVPKDSYGLTKMMMNRLAEQSNNVYNFRIFGCFGPNDHESKFITHCIRSVLLNVPITIRKDCYFDYIHVYDFGKYISWGLDAELKAHNYNVTTGRPILLSDIAKIVVEKMQADVEVQLLSQERNNNYTASNRRIKDESGFDISIDIEKGIEMQIQWEKENWNPNTKFDGR